MFTYCHQVMSPATITVEYLIISKKEDKDV